MNAVKRSRKSTQEKLAREFSRSKEEIRRAKLIDQATDIEIEALQWFIEQRLVEGAVPWVMSSALYLAHLEFGLKGMQPAPEWADYLRRIADRIENGECVLPFAPPPLTKAWMERQGMEITEQ